MKMKKIEMQSVRVWLCVERVYVEREREDRRQNSVERDR